MSLQKKICCLTPGHVTLATLREIYHGVVTLSLDSRAIDAVIKSQQTVEAIVNHGDVVYGINTGFGKLAQTTIAKEHLAELQRNLVLSHSVGLGQPLTDDVVRLVMASKIISLARGHTGVRMDV